MKIPSSFLAVPAWLKEILDDPFRRYFFLALCLLALTLIVRGEEKRPQEGLVSEEAVHFFYHPTCPHCRDQKQFHLYLQQKYPELSIIGHDTSRPEEVDLLVAVARERGVRPERLAVPITFVGPYVLIGFDRPENSGVTLEKAIAAHLHKTPELFTESDEQWLARDTVDLGWLGVIRTADYSLPVLTVLFGVIDGFNPCAMWVLVYMLSLVAGLNDRKKVWILAGTFLAASAVLYFLLMTAWLNVFLFLGYLRPLTIVIGCFAMGAGGLSVREYWRDKGEVSCKVVDPASRKKTMNRIERVMATPLSLATLTAIIILAFVINSIEFACSAALPAIYTHILSLHHLATLKYYGYILLYDFFFMLDDLIIFTLAILALESSVGQRYAGHCKAVGGILLLVLGVIMVFWPELLR
jgi:hypothetical protein